MGIERQKPGIDFATFCHYPNHMAAHVLGYKSDRCILANCIIVYGVVVHRRSKIEILLKIALPSLSGARDIPYWKANMSPWQILAIKGCFWSLSRPRL